MENNDLPYGVLECVRCGEIYHLEHECGKQNRINRLETELTAARAEIERLRDVLRQVQWSSTCFDPESGEDGTVYEMCPLCDQQTLQGHAPDCLVGMCLEPK